MKYLPAMPRASAWIFAAIAVLCATGLGCSGSNRPASARANGKVICHGQPLTSGEVHFVRPDTGDAGSAPLDSSGAYTLAAGIPPGTYRVFFLPPPDAAHPSVNDTAGMVSTPISPIPERYRNEVSSGVTAEVKAGRNTLDFELQ